LATSHAAVGASLYVFTASGAVLELARRATGVGSGWIEGRAILARFPAFELMMLAVAVGAVMAAAAFAGKDRSRWVAGAAAPDRRPGGLPVRRVRHGRPDAGRGRGNHRRGQLRRSGAACGKLDRTPCHRGGRRGGGADPGANGGLCAGLAAVGRGASPRR